MRIVIFGIARNCGSVIRNELEILVNAFKNHSIVRFIIVSSDCEDQTTEILEEWDCESTINTHIPLGNLEGVYPKRTERIAYCRNVYIDFAERYNYFNADYAFVTDLDSVNNCLDQQTIDRALELLKNLHNSAITTNQKYKYYDIWALRHPIWSPNDCWKSFHQLKNVLGEINSQNICNLSRMIHIDSDSDLIEVDSSFGGGAFYPTNLLSGCRYSGLDNGFEVCEHVSFSRCFKENGGHIYIAPFLINHDYSEHVINAEKFFTKKMSESIIRYD